MQTRALAGLAFLALGGAVAGLVVISVCNWPAAQAAYRDQYVAATFTVTNLRNGSYACCVVGGCQCADAPAGSLSCRTLLAQVRPGTCANGYHCCRTAYHTCHRTCYRNQCCRTCPKCACHPCDAYQCNPYACDPYCAQSVDNQVCVAACGTCYRPSFDYTYHNGSGRAPASLHRTAPSACAMNDRTCLAAFLHAHPNGSTVAGFYNKANPQDIVLGALDAPAMPAPLVAGYVLLTVLGAAALLMAIFLVLARASAPRRKSEMQE